MRLLHNPLLYLLMVIVGLTATIICCGCLRLQPTVQAQNELNGPPGYNWCCSAGVCYELVGCRSNPPAVNCPQCYPTFLGCLTGCGLPE